ncbi:MAG: TraB/GumN family protein, partial [Alphaproteobacteria bacterium]|nr:TraB/GumN family protein [Alphaproteobacteria bacterium]
TYFVTVGAAHLVGPLGVPKLLRDKGFRVEGP